MPTHHFLSASSDDSLDHSEESGSEAAAATPGAEATPAKPRVMRAMAFQPMDPELLAQNGLDVRNCASLEIESGDMLFDAVIEYVADNAPAASPSLMLPSGTWRRNENNDPGAEKDDAETPSGAAKKDDGDEVPNRMPPPFEPIYSMGPGVTRLPTPDGSWVAVASAVGKYFPSRGQPPRLACLYTPLEAGPGGSAATGAAAATDASADTSAATDAPATDAEAAPDAEAASTDTTAAGNSVAPASAETPNGNAAADAEGDGASESATAAPAADGDDSSTAVGATKQPHEYARERFTALIMAVLKWKRANENKQRKVDWFHLFRFELHGDSHGRWRLSGRHLTRPVDTIVLDPTIRDALLDDARAFDTKAALRWYTLHGLPYRRCYLFYGPPGTGKSSFIRALAGVLKRSVAFFQCAHNKLNDQILADAFRDCPSQSILVLEDIDCLFTSAAGGVGARESRSEVHISLAGLLNALDGLLSGTRGRITVLSSNHPQLLDAALIRSGRVDHTVEFALPTRADMATLFTGFYPEATAASAKAFADKVFSVSMNTEDRTVATMQQLFIKYRGRSIKEVLDGVEGFVEARRSGPMGVNGHSPGVYL